MLMDGLLKMNYICKVFGHRFICRIAHTNYLTGLYSARILNEPICKRCGLTRKELFRLASRRGSL